jgi:hypothetical protein
MKTDPLPYMNTNAGLQMSVELIPYWHVGGGTLVCAHPLPAENHVKLFVPLLHCGDSESKFLHSIVLKRLKSNGKRFVRVGSDFVVVNTSLLEAERRKLNIEQILCLQAFHLADSQILDRKRVPKSSLAS